MEFPIKLYKQAELIGLYLAKGIVEKYWGRIEATSPGLGKGAVFSVYLPNLE